MTAYPNDTVKTIMERRSIRKYKPQQISEEELNCILDCGLWAPSARNTQNWHFTVIQNGGLISWMNEKTKENMAAGGRQTSKDFNVYYNAPTVILISGDANDSWMTDNCAYAVENMCLAAQSLGIASVIIGMARFLFGTSETGAYTKEFGVPEGYKPLYAVCFGYSDDKPEPPKRIGGKINYIK
jgi:nitroreductase